MTDARDRALPPSHQINSESNGHTQVIHLVAWSWEQCWLITSHILKLGSQPLVNQPVFVPSSQPGSEHGFVADWPEGRTLPQLTLLAALPLPGSSTSKTNSQRKRCRLLAGSVLVTVGGDLPSVYSDLWSRYTYVHRLLV